MEQYGNTFEELTKSMEQANECLSKIIFIRKTSIDEVSKFDADKLRYLGLKFVDIEESIRDN